MSNETGTHLGEESRPVSVSFLQVLYNVGIIPAREQYRDINKGVVRSGSSSRAPHGARRPGGAVCELQLRFQSTRPARGATGDGAVAAREAPVSIHAPLARSFLSAFSFQSTRPARGATVNSYVSMN